MPKVYNLLDKGTQQTDDWQARANGISLADIDTLNTGDNDRLRSDPTSLPTPFARIDLFDTAFKQATKDLEDGSYAQKLDTWYNQKVSHALDLAQLLFEHDKHPDLKIVAWHKPTEMQALTNHPDQAAKAFGKVLELYLSQDGKTYGFDRVDVFYIFYWKVPECVLGGTSPATLFFTTGNNLTAITAGAHLNGRQLFGSVYQPLHERGIEFQIYLHQLGKLLNMPSFRPLQALLGASKNLLQKTSPTLRQQLDKALETQPTYKNIAVGTGSLLFCGVNIGQQGPKPITSQNTTLLLAPSKPQTELVPIVMPNYDRSGHRYPDGAEYDNSHYHEAEAQKDTPIELRRLPRENSEHPFLIANDLLADNLLLYNYTPNADAFLLAPSTLPLCNRTQTGYLLPLTAKFFEYFTTQDLIEGTLALTPNPVKPRLEFEIEEQNDELNHFRMVRAILTLPGQGGKTCSLIRTYYLTLGNTTDISNGQLKTGEFNTSIFPFVRNAGHYRVGAVAKDVVSGFSIKLFDSQVEAHKSDKTDSANRTRDFGSGSKATYHACTGNIDVVEINLNGTIGYLIPKLKEWQSVNREVHFSIDFGTSNTHIEYKVIGQADAKALSYKPGDGFVEDMLSEKADERKRNSNLRDQFWFEFMPGNTEEKTAFHLPRRTALYKGKDTKSPVALRDVNFSIGYTTNVHTLSASDFVTNLKWGNSNDAAYLGQVKAFIDELAMLMWAKALVEGANLSTCHAVWFYPISMNKHKRGEFVKLWADSLDKYFNFSNKDKQIVYASESYAPYKFYQKRGGVLDATGTSVLVDIGGGTTDVLIFDSTTLKHQGSLRYAGGHAFGNGFNTDSQQNGFYTAMLKAIEQYPDAQSIVEQTLEGNDADIGSLLFALKPAGFNFAEELKERNPELKCVPLVFFLSIIYHVACLSKSLAAPPPRYLLFSGNGSRILRILVANPQAKQDNALVELSTKILEYVYQTPIINKLEFRLDEEPKVLTAKGGIELLAAEKGSQLPVEGISMAGKAKDNDLLTMAEVEAGIEILTATVKDCVAAMRDAMAHPALFDGLGISKTAWAATMASIETNAKDMLLQGLQQRKQQGQDNLTEDPWVLGLAGQLGMLARELQNQS